MMTHSLLSFMLMLPISTLGFVVPVVSLNKDIVVDGVIFEDDDNSCVVELKINNRLLNFNKNKFLDKNQYFISIVFNGICYCKCLVHT